MKVISNCNTRLSQFLTHDLSPRAAGLSSVEYRNAMWIPSSCVLAAGGPLVGTFKPRVPQKTGSAGFAIAMGTLMTGSAHAVIFVFYLFSTIELTRATVVSRYGSS